MYPISQTNTSGEIIGWINFPAGGPPSGTVSWIKTAAANTSPYATGLTNTVAILSSPYTATTPSSPDVFAGMTYGNATFAGGNLTNNIDDQILMTNNGAVYCFDHNMSMKFTSGGLFTGKFRDNGTGKSAAFFGVAQQNSTTGYGYFLGLSQSGSFTLAPAP